MKNVIIIVFFLGICTFSQLYSQKINNLHEDSVLLKLGTKPFMGYLDKEQIKLSGLTKKIKARLVYLASLEWSNSDLEKLLGNGEFKIKYHTYLKNDSLNSIKFLANKFLYNRNLDSLAKISFEKTVLDFKHSDSYKVYKVAIKYCADLGINAIVPILQNDYINNKKLYDEDFVLTCLSKLGDKKSMKALIDKYPYIKSLENQEWHTYFEKIKLKFIYINQFLSIEHIIKWLDTTKKFVPKSLPHTSNAKLNIQAQSVQWVLFDLKWHISNKDFLVLFDNYELDPYLATYDNLNDLTLKARQWLRFNRKKIKLKYEIFE